MDVGFYLGELLVQQGEVSVPGLGYFVKVRMSSYYNEAERKFYPPFHQVQFDTEFIEDEALAVHIAQKKNISVASARYFSEKYIAGLKEQALDDEVPIGDLGWFYTDHDRLAFRPADKLGDDSAFFGLRAVSISKAGEVKSGVKITHMILTPPIPKDLPPLSPEMQVTDLPPDVPAPETMIEQQTVIAEETPAYVPAAATEEDPEYIYSADDPSVSLDIAGEEYVPEKNNGTLRLLLIIFGSIAIICAAIFALYQYQPDVFAKMASWTQPAPKPAPTVKPKVIVPVKPDTAVNDSLKTDTTTLKKDSVTKVTVPVAKTPVVTTPPVNTTKLPPAATSNPVVAALIKQATDAGVPISPATGTKRFEVSAGTVKSMRKVKEVIENLKRKGLDAWYTPDFTGPFKHVSIGYFATEKEAKALAVRSIESGKVSGDAYAIEIIPQK